MSEIIEIVAGMEILSKQKDASGPIRQRRGQLSCQLGLPCSCVGQNADQSLAKAVMNLVQKLVRKVNVGHDVGSKHCRNVPGTTQSTWHAPQIRVSQGHTRRQLLPQKVQVTAAKQSVRVF
ncbi:MAG: hypothetical protein U1G07_17105 [Verrucomicrobiota bacterium]